MLKIVCPQYSILATYIQEVCIDVIRIWFVLNFQQLNSGVIIYITMRYAKLHDTDAIVTQ